MSTIKSFSVISFLALGAIAATTGCSADMDSAEGVGAISEAIATGNKFYGSDTMKTSVVAATATYGVANLSYQGSGSGNGEKCLRGDASGPCGATTRELWAPMSRDLTGPVANCTSADDFKSRRVAIDGIVIDTATAAANTATNVTQAELAKLYCATGTGAVGCAMPQTAGGVSFSKAYRRDDASGSTEVFREKLNMPAGFCTSLCSDANHITVTETSHPTQCPGLTATECIGRLTQSNFGGGSATTSPWVIGYAGLSSTKITTPPKVLNVDGIDPITGGTHANIRNFTYRFSRYLYVNYNQDMLLRANAAGPALNNATATERRSLCEMVFGGAVGTCSGLANPIGGAALTNRKLAFENELVSKGDFLRCSTTNPPTLASALNCSQTGVTCP